MPYGPFNALYKLGDYQLSNKIDILYPKSILSEGVDDNKKI